MAADGINRHLTRVVPDEDSSAKRCIDSLHHAERPREPANDTDVLREQIDEQILRIAVGVGQHERGGAGRPGALDRGACLGRHPLAGLGVFEPGGTELRRLHDARDPFHVHGNEDFAGIA
jgi:hypothetical protein